MKYQAIKEIQMNILSKLFEKQAAKFLWYIIGVGSILLLLWGCSPTPQNWTVTVVEAVQANRLQGPGMSFTSKGGYTFLVVNITFHNPKPDKDEQEYAISNLEIVSEDGETSPPYALGVPMGDIMFATLDTANFSFPSSLEETSLILAFEVKQETLDKTFKLQAQNISPTSFSVDK